MRDTQTALIVMIPEAEPAIAPLRAALDSSASWGVPAHVSVLFPFLAPDLIDESALAAVRETVRTLPRFDLTFARTAWFGDQVLWLAPEPDRPLRDLTAALYARFPQTPPYGGEFDDVVPHLTVGHDATREVLDAAAAAVAPHLPIRARVSAVTLIAGRPEPGDSWHRVADFPLGPSVP